jgi:FkbM family methyltransferase
MLCSVEPPIIIDGGAHKGESIDTITSVFDNVNIHAVEANPGRASELENKYDSENIEIYNVALGPENDEVEFNITKKDQSSSILDSTDKNVDSFGEKVAVEKQVMVEQNRLDNIIEFSPDIIKLDLQGYELRALEGARDLLQSVELVLVETSFRELYEGQATFCELHAFLQRNGFSIFNIYETYTTETGELAEFDALYRSTD